MTRLEKFYEVEVIGKRCPSYVSVGGPEYDSETSNISNEGRILGCRGITCEECWNKEFGED